MGFVWIDPGPPARGQPSSLRDAIRVPPKLTRDVRADPRHDGSRQRLDEV